jgi:hypothetical protein
MTNQDQHFWQTIWYLSILTSFVVMIMSVVLLAGRGLRLSLLTNIFLGVILLITVFGCVGFATRLRAIDRLSFEARVFWPTMSLLAYLCFVIAGLSAVALLVSYLNHAFLRFRSAFLALFILAVIGFWFIPPIIGTPSPDVEIVNLYNEGIRAVLANNFTEAQQELRDYEGHAWLLGVWRPRPYKKIDPDIGSASDIVTSIDGGVMTQEDIANCKLQSRQMSICYAIRPTGHYIILLNILSDGRVYLLTRDGSGASQLGVMVPETWDTQSIPDDIYELIQQGIDERTLLYQCPSCYEDTLAAYLQDPAFVDNASIQVDRLGSLEYYNLCCNGQQVNGYWEPDSSPETPPWTIFRQAILDVIKETLENGTTISTGTYLSGLQEAEAQYGFKSLTGYQWSKFYIESTFQLSN